MIVVDLSWDFEPRVFRPTSQRSQVPHRVECFAEISSDEVYMGFMLEKRSGLLEDRD